MVIGSSRRIILVLPFDTSAKMLVRRASHAPPFEKEDMKIPTDLLKIFKKKEAEWRKEGFIE
jgi:CRISPR/Cas system-associated endonuclease/helicase Cas3